MAIYNRRDNPDGPRPVLKHSMDFFNLSLPRRLSLAFLSGLSVWLLAVFPGLSDRGLWLVAILFGLLVLVPFISRDTHRLVRALALVLTMVIAQALVVFLSVDLGNYLGLGELELIINILLGTLLICVATGAIAPITLNRRYIGHAIAAGVLSGVAFYLIVGHLWRVFCFDPCPWYNDLIFASGWIIWYMSICAAIYLGKANDSST